MDPAHVVDRHQTAALLRDLTDAVGSAGVLTDPASRLVYSYDGAIDKALPSAVVLPRTSTEVAAVVRACVAAGVPYVARGAGTNLCGGAIPAEGGVVIHMSRLNRIISVDPSHRTAVVEPGVVNLHLQTVVKAHGLFYAPDPASQKACTLGGNVGTNAGGPHCLKHGVTTHHVTALEVVMPDGRMARMGRDRAGLDLTGLFVGSEGTLGIVTKIQVRLLPMPAAIRTLLVPFPTLEDAVKTVADVIADGVTPTTLELMDRLTVDAVEAFVHAGYPEKGEGVLLIEVDGDPKVVAANVARVRSLCEENGCLEFREAHSEAERERMWEGRRGAYAAMALLAPNVLVEDGVVPRHRLPEAFRRIRAIAERDHLRVGVIAHAGDGNLHPNIVFDERDAAETARAKAAGSEMIRVCVDLGGSISGEHGIGIDKRAAMAWLFTPDTLAVFRRLKDAFDPLHLCNPDKLIPEAPSSSPREEIVPVSMEPGVRLLADWGELPGLLAGARRSALRVKLTGHSHGVLASKTECVLVFEGLNGLIEHETANFTVTVEAGMDVDQLISLLAAQNQHLHLPGGTGLTVGGILSGDHGRSDRMRADVIGLRAVTGLGEDVSFGGKVMKNVAGYDVVKLFLGARGALGVVREVTFRVHPGPAAPATESVCTMPAMGDSTSAVLADVTDRIKAVFDPAGVLPDLPRGESV